MEFEVSPATVVSVNLLIKIFAMLVGVNMDCIADISSITAAHAEAAKTCCCWLIKMVFTYNNISSVQHPD